MIGNRRSKYKFSDSQMQFNHDVRIWICGAEVTDHLRGSINLRRGDRNGPSTFQFELDNVKDIFVITPENKGYKDENGRYVKDENAPSVDISNALSEEAKKKIDTIYKEVNQIEEEIQALDEKKVLDHAELYSNYQKNLEKAKKESEKALQTGDRTKIETTDRKLLDLRDKYNKDDAKIDEDWLKELEKLERKKKIALSRISNINRSQNADGSYSYTSNEIGTFGTEVVGNDVLSRIQRYKKKKESDKNSELVSNEIIFKTNPEIYNDHMYSDSAKKSIFYNKVILNANINLGGFIKDDGIGFKAYQLSIDTPIIEKHDPVRIFIRDPSYPFLNVDNEDKDNDGNFEGGRWVPIFTGFIDTVSDHSDYTNGDKFLSVSCYDIRGMMQRMRVMTNPRISRGTDTARERAEQAKKFSVNTGYFTDFFAQGGMWGEKSTKYLHHAFDQVCLEFITGRWHHWDKFADTYVGKVVSSQSNEIVENDAMFKEINKSWKENGRTSEASLNGIGTFIPGVIMECPRYDTDKDKCIQMMELWYDILMFGTKAEYFTREEMEKVGCATLPYGEYDPYNCFVHMITPPNGTPAKDLFDSQLEDLQTGFDYKPRFEFMSELVERLDYQWFTNSMGDIVIEFPMYDFTPDVFGAYEESLTVDNHLVSTVLNEVADTVYSGVSISGGINSIVGGVWQPVQFIYSAFAKSDQLAYKYGININEVTAGNLKTNTSKEKLRNQAIIELIKSNIAASSMEMEVIYRFAIFPNKPIKNVPKHRMATITGFSYSMQINESVSCTIDTSMVKKLNEDNTYTNIYNAPNMPIKYLGTNAIDITALQSGIDAFYIGADGNPASDVEIKK
jgi:hypothetical protein